MPQIATLRCYQCDITFYHLTRLSEGPAWQTSICTFRCTYRESFTGRPCRQLLALFPLVTSVTPNICFQKCSSAMLYSAAFRPEVS